MGVPPAGWVFDKGKSQSEMDDDWGYPYFRKPPYFFLYHYPDIRGNSNECDGLRTTAGSRLKKPFRILEHCM